MQCVTRHSRRMQNPIGKGVSNLRSLVQLGDSNVHIYFMAHTHRLKDNYIRANIGIYTAYGYTPLNIRNYFALFCIKKAVPSKYFVKLFQTSYVVS